MAEYEVHVKVEHTLRFTITAESAAKAAHEAVASLWDGVTPEEDEVTDTEVAKFKAADQEIDVSRMLDWNAPKGKFGLTPWKFVAWTDGYGRKLAEGADLATVLDAAESALAAEAKDGA